MEEIALLWIGAQEPDVKLIAHARSRIGRAFAAPVTLLPAPGRPPDAFDPRRGQYCSTRILAWLREGGAGPGAGRVLAITDGDLFIPILTFVFGEAQLGGRAAVVSTARLGDETRVLGKRLLAERLAKECVHELGHTYGLLHCGTPRCVMARSASVRDVDAKSAELCPECQARLGENEPKG